MIDYHLLEIGGDKSNECVVIILAHVSRNLMQCPLNFHLGGVSETLLNQNSLNFHLWKIILLEGSLHVTSNLQLKRDRTDNSSRAKSAIVCCPISYF